VYTPQQSAGKRSIFGGGGGGGVTWSLSGWNYSADLMMALCERDNVDFGDFQRTRRRLKSLAK
jgi:hypothetical protein